MTNLCVCILSGCLFCEFLIQFLMSINNLKFIGLHQINN